MRRARLEVIKARIFEMLERQSRRVYTIDDIASLLSGHRENWELPASATLQKFLEFLHNEGKLIGYRFDFLYQPTTLYLSRSPHPLEIAMRIRPRGYLSHSSAMQFHGWPKDNDSRVIYVNDEQKPKSPPRSTLQQERIDAAFQRPPRRSNNLVVWEGRTFIQLSGMHTGLLGVIERELPDVPIPVRVTSIERTLIDIAVRPAYAGGTQAVLNAYQQASRDVDVQTLINLLDKIKYIYPYHQSIGFYMEHSGCYSPEQMELIRCIPRHYNFYLDYEIRDPSFDKTWRIFYPKSLDHALSL